MNLPTADKHPEGHKLRLRATEYQLLQFGTFTRGKPRGIEPGDRLKKYFVQPWNLIQEKLVCKVYSIKIALDKTTYSIEGLP